MGETHNFMYYLGEFGHGYVCLLIVFGLYSSWLNNWETIISPCRVGTDQKKVIFIVWCFVFSVFITTPIIQMFTCAVILGMYHRMHVKI